LNRASRDSKTVTECLNENLLSKPEVVRENIAQATPTVDILRENVKKYQKSFAFNPFARM